MTETRRNLTVTLAVCLAGAAVYFGLIFDRDSGQPTTSSPDVRLDEKKGSGEPLESMPDVTSATDVSATHSPNDILKESPVVDPAPDAGTLELFRSVQSLTLQDQLVAEGAAQGTAQSFSPDIFIRWNPILITDERMFFDEVKDGDEVTYIPRKTVSLSPFPGTIFVAENRRFRADSLGFSWTGEIVSGGTGRVSIKLLLVGNGEQHVDVDILSDSGAFRIQRTNKTPYYVALEHNPHRQIDFM